VVTTGRRSAARSRPLTAPTARLSVAVEVIMGAHVGNRDGRRTGIVADFYVKRALLVVVQECATHREPAKERAESTGARDRIARIVDV